MNLSKTKTKSVKSYLHEIFSRGDLKLNNCKYVYICMINSSQYQSDNASIILRHFVFLVGFPEVYIVIKYLTCNFLMKVNVRVHLRRTHGIDFIILRNHNYGYI